MATIADYDAEAAPAEDRSHPEIAHPKLRGGTDFGRCRCSSGLDALAGIAISARAIGRAVARMVQKGIAENLAPMNQRVG
jgi:hypothetical protein